jgi:hypothetical protein
MACPEVKMVKLKKRPSNYLLRSSQRSLTASNRHQEEKEKPKVDFRPQSTRNVKTIESIDEWDCPKPGSKVMPRSVKENIKKNRKKFETYYRSKTQADSVQSRTPGNQP